MPAENFTRDGIYHLIVYTAPIDASKFFWFICILLLLLGKLKIIQKYKVQPEDHVPWKKLPKVFCLKYNFKRKFIKAFLSLDRSQLNYESVHCWNIVHKVHLLPCRTCDEVQHTGRCKSCSKLSSIYLRALCQQLASGDKLLLHPPTTSHQVFVQAHPQDAP